MFYLYFFMKLNKIVDRFRRKYDSVIFKKNRIIDSIFTTSKSDQKSLWKIALETDNAG